MHIAAEEFGGGATHAIDLVYESLLNPSAWDMFLRASCQLIDAQSACVIAPNHGRGRGAFLSVGLPAGVVEQYNQYFHHLDPWWAAAELPAAGGARLLRGEAITPDHALLSSEFYLEFLRPAGMRWMRGLALRPAVPAARGYVIGWLRGPRGAPFDEAADAQVEAIGRHLLRAERIASQVLMARFEVDPAAPAVFVLDARGCLLQANQSASAMIREGHFACGEHPLRAPSREATLWLNGFFDPLGARARTGAAGWGGARAVDAPSSGLASLAAKAAAADSVPCAGTVGESLGRLVSELRRGVPHQLEVFALRGSGSSLGLFGAARILVVQHTNRRSGDALLGQARKLYDWTRSECETSRMLAHGVPLAQIAAERACSIETVRTHLKHAKRKAGVNRQVELVRLLLQLETDPS